MICYPAQGSHTAEILIDTLADDGFESFTENSDGTITAYIQEPDFSDELNVKLQSAEYSELLKSFTFSKIEDQNWNAVWESQYEPVNIEGRCQVRAPFHAQIPGIEFDIVIMPKMSFGTAHHETTRLMISYMLSLQLIGKSLLDMGSGTGVLAILAAMKGAEPVAAIDNDEWAYNNALENTLSNNFGNIEVILGDSDSLAGKSFDIIFANINRNILLNDIPVYRKSLNSSGKLFVSGFYSEDLPLIEAKADEYGLKLLSKRIENNWTAACFCV